MNGAGKDRMNTKHIVSSVMCRVKCDNAGKTQLLQHSKQKKHIDAIKHSVDKKQKKLVAFSKQSGESSACSSQSLGLITPGDSMNAEIFWLAKVSVSNLSLRSVDNIGDLFRAMFPDINCSKLQT